MAMAAGMMYYAFYIYILKKTKVLEDNQISAPVHRLLVNKYGFDELYDSMVRKPLDAASAFSAKWIEPKWIDGIVNGTAHLTKQIGQTLRATQNGRLVNYIVVMIAALIALILTLI
jgi:NADH-quinone oxidoreductase subunit L